MRSTVRIDDDLLTELKGQARRQKTSLTRMLNRVLRAGLRASQRRTTAQHVVNEDAAHHETLLEWWDEVVAGDESIGLPWMVLLGFLRIATSAKIFPHPLAPEVAVRAIDEWLAVDNVCVVTEKDNHWEVLHSLPMRPARRETLPRMRILRRSR